MIFNNQSVYIIAEVGSVHDGSFGNALKLIDLAKECGADAVKFQTHISEAETLPDAPMPPYFKGEPRFEYFNRTGFTLPQWQALKTHADEAGIDFISSPFSLEAVDLLESLDIPIYKIPSGEVSNTPLLEKAAQTQKQVLISSGMSDWRELEQAVSTVMKSNQNVSVMQCSSAYPCPNERVGLNVILEMQKRWGLPVGYSDHTLDNHAVFGAVSLGATVIEKHLTFSRRMYGSDALNSAEPDQFKEMVKGVHAIKTMLNSPVDKNDLDPYNEMKMIFEKSVVSIADIKKGDVFSHENISIKKPGNGIPAAKLKEIIGCLATQDILKDQLLKEIDIEENK